MQKKSTKRTAKRKEPTAHASAVTKTVSQIVGLANKHDNNEIGEAAR